MIKRALSPGGAFSIYSEGETDCQPKMAKILGIPLFYIFYEYIEWKVNIILLTSNVINGERDGYSSSKS